MMEHSKPADWHVDPTSDMMHVPCLRDRAKQFDFPNSPVIKTTSPMSNQESNETDIAIVGMAAHLPGARNIGEFWRNVRDGVESIQTFTDEQLLAEGEPPENGNPEGQHHVVGEVRRGRQPPEFGRPEEL